MTDHQHDAGNARSKEHAPLPRGEIAGLSGLEVLDRMLDGQLPLPPFGATMDITPVSASAGRIVFAGRPKAAFPNPSGTVQGGRIATILDTAMACAVHSTLKAGQSYTTTSLSISYVRALLSGEVDVRCEASALFSGRRTATGEGRLYDAEGRLIAHGTETCRVLDKPTVCIRPISALWFHVHPKTSAFRSLHSSALK